MLSDQELNQIRAEAEKEYPEGGFGWQIGVGAYIAAATKYQERINGLLEASKEIDDYLSVTHYESGQPIRRNTMGPDSILHRNLSKALVKYYEQDK